MTIIDISPAIAAATPVFPGDTAFSAVRTWALGEDCPVNVSKFETTTHIGAHADAPLHYDARGAAIDEVPLGAYIGPCTVFHALDVKRLLSAEQLQTLIRGRTLAPRVLIRFYQTAPQSEWDAGFPAIAAEAIHWLADRGVILVGVDTPSLDPQSSKLMDAHRAVFARDMRILEGLVLDAVEEGDYELIAPPLKLQGLDAAPVRAVLRTL
jgi:arylformamidase